MKKILAIVFLNYFFLFPVYSQYKIGFQAGGVINFQTVNSFIENSITHQMEYHGTGQSYKPAFCYNSGLTFEIKMFKKTEANLMFEYMLKKVRLCNSWPGYLYDIDYHYFRIPIGLKIRKSDIFYYDFGLVNNILLKYDKDLLYRDFFVDGKNETHKYNLGFYAGTGFVILKKYELFLRGETDITPFFNTTDMGTDGYYPFKFHNFTLGLRYWFYNHN